MVATGWVGDITVAHRKTVAALAERTIAAVAKAAAAVCSRTLLVIVMERTYALWDSSSFRVSPRLSTDPR
jgi:hypothetical protein